MDKKKHIMTMAGVIILVSGGMFYGGMLYGTSKATKGTAQFVQGQNRGMNNGAGAPGGANGGVAGGQRGQRTPGGMANGAGPGGGFSNGQIIAKDDTSITIKTRDGGSKIVYYSGSTTIGKTTPGSASDLSVGEDVMVNGASSPDGSIAAENIQIRPTQSAGQELGQN
ncbi:MAG: hypothetical protein WC848_04070 [Parcubacteria group bacterium]|jgi:hypothetical protein